MLWLKTVVILGGGLFLSLMELALLISVAPQMLRITRPLVLPPEWTMEISLVKSSYHRPGERGLVVMGYGPGGARDVKTSALLAFWAFLFLDAVITAAVLVFVFWR